METELKDMGMDLGGCWKGAEVGGGFEEEGEGVLAGWEAEAEHMREEEEGRRRCGRGGEGANEGVEHE